MEKSEIKGFIAKRVAQELKDGDVVNLGIGLPTLVPAYLPEGVHVILQSENGIIGTGAKPTPEEADPRYKTDAGGQPAQAAPFGCYIDSATSFGFIRGGHAVNTPPVRYAAVRLVHAPLVSLGAHQWFTDTTNAYRAYSREYLTHPRCPPAARCLCRV